MSNALETLLGLAERALTRPHLPADAATAPASSGEQEIGPVVMSLLAVGSIVLVVWLKHPFRGFFTNTLRGGSEPADVIDVFGTADDSPNLRYARIRLAFTIDPREQ